MGSLFLLQGIFPAQGSNPGFRITGGFFTSCATTPKSTGVGSLSLLQWIFLTQESNQGLLHCRQVLYQLSYKGSPAGKLANSQRYFKYQLINKYLLNTRRKWQPTPVFLPGESQGRGSLVGCRLWGRTESDTTEATQQQQQQHISKGK